MYIIESGVVDVFLERTHGREHIAEFGALDVLGELSLVDPAPRSATAEARKETVLYEVLGDDFEQMLTQLHPAAFKIVRSLARVVCRRIRTVHERIDAELSGTTPPGPHTGDFDRKVGRKAAITSPHETVAVPGKPRSGKSPVTSGVIRRAISKLWGSDE
jgi:CRP-like cAMP-binding protein